MRNPREKTWSETHWHRPDITCQTHCQCRPQGGQKLFSLGSRLSSDIFMHHTNSSIHVYMWTYCNMKLLCYINLWCADKPVTLAKRGKKEGKKSFGKLFLMYQTEYKAIVFIITKRADFFMNNCFFFLRHTAGNSVCLAENTSLLRVAMLHLMEEQKQKHLTAN